MLLLTHKEIENLLDPSELLAALEEGFKTLSAGQLNVPPRNQAIAPKGLLVGMPAYMPNKLMSVKLVTIFHENIPAHQATITLFDSNKGTPIAFMDGEFITAMRTSLRTVDANLLVMIFWGAIVVTLTAIGFLTLFFGLIVLMPLIGHASWHAYRDLVE